MAFKKGYTRSGIVTESSKTSLIATRRYSLLDIGSAFGSEYWESCRHVHDAPKLSVVILQKKLGILHSRTFCLALYTAQM